MLPLAAERGALEDSEAVLLVDHGQAEPLELHRLLDEGVRSHADGGGAAAEGLQRGLALSQSLAGGEPCDGEPERLDEAPQRPEVLLGQDLGRRHE